VLSGPFAFRRVGTGVSSRRARRQAARVMTASDCLLPVRY